MNATQVFSYLVSLYPWLAPAVSYVSIVVAVASLLDSRFPQPNPGSNWLPVRKAISFLALNWGFAANAGQPPLLTWFIKVLVVALKATPGGSTAAAAGLGAEQILSLVTQAESQAQPAPPPAPAPAAAPQGTH